MSDSRLEKFIYAICSMDVSDLPVPLSRIEKLWNCLITGETPDFEPLSRNEKYLMAMLDRYDISNLPAPMSRGEKLLYKIAVGETDLSDVPGYLSRYEELLKYLIKNGVLSDFEYVLYTLNQSLSTLYSTVEKPVKSAILTGSTKYRDIDTGEVLDAFEDGRNLELVSVRMPVLTTTGKNLFDINQTVDGYFGSNGNISQPDFNNKVSNYIKVKPNTVYIYSFDGFSNNDVGGIYWTGWFYYNSQKEIIGSRQVNSGGNESNKKITFTTPSDCNYIRIGSRGLSLNGATVQLEEGSVATPYEPYKTNILTVNEDVTLRGIGEGSKRVEDELDCLTGEVTERVGEVVLDGSEKWFLNDNDPTDTNLLRFTTNSALLNAKKVSSDSLEHYLTDTFAKHTNWKIMECAWVHYNDGRVNVVIKKDKLISLDNKGFRSWLSQNPITIQYQLETESTKTVDLTTVDQDGQPTKLKTFNDISHVEINADNIIPSVDVEVATKISGTLSTLGLDHHNISETQNKLSQTIDEQSENTDATMMATTEIYEQTL